MPVNADKWAIVAAGLWSLAYGALGLYWALGGAGFPFGAGDPDAELSLLGNARAAVAGPIIAGLGGIGVIVALAMTRPWGRRLPRRVLLGYGWGACLILLVIVPDVRLLTTLGYLPALLFRLGLESVTWPVVNQVVCVIGGIAWGAAAMIYGRGTAAAPDRCQADEAIGPRWRRWVTYAAVLVPLPYAVSRLAWALGVPLGVSEAFLADLEASGAVVAEVSLGGMALGGALLTLGLIQRWGEVFPGWIPGLGGKRVPPALAIVPATIATIALVVGGLGLYRQLVLFGLPIENNWFGAGAPALVFVPWGVLLGLATYAYAERRRCEGAALRGT